LKQIEAIGRYGLSIDDVNNVVEAAIGGMTDYY
jgi:Cu(I)/Ag(I) efflux system membrane protein CusA/SilA